MILCVSEFMLHIFYSKYSPSLSTHFIHLSGNLWIPFQKKASSFIDIHSSSHFRTSSKVLKCCSANAWEHAKETVHWTRSLKISGLKDDVISVLKSYFLSAGYINFRSYSCHKLNFRAMNLLIYALSNRL